MRLIFGAACLMATVCSIPAMADPPPVNADGVYRCISMCRGGVPGGRALIGQSGWQVNLANEVGDTAWGYIEWPRRIWVDRWNMGANVSPDGIKVQFDNGEVWVREVPVVPYAAGPYAGRRGWGWGAPPPPVQ